MSVRWPADRGLIPRVAAGGTAGAGDPKPGRARRARLSPVRAVRGCCARAGGVRRGLRSQPACAAKEARDASGSPRGERLCLVVVVCFLCLFFPLLLFSSLLLNCSYPNPRVLPLLPDSPPHPPGQGWGAAHVFSCWVGGAGLGQSGTQRSWCFPSL